MCVWNGRSEAMDIPGIADYGFRFVSTLSFGEREGKVWLGGAKGRRSLVQRLEREGDARMGNGLRPISLLKGKSHGLRLGARDDPAMSEASAVGR